MNVPVTAAASTKSKEQLLAEFSVSEQGLSSSEANKRQKLYGPNVVHGEPLRWFSVLFRQLRSSFVYLLAGATLLSFLLRELIDALFIVLFILVNAGLGFYQEYRSEHTLRFLKKFIIQKARVRRDDQEILVKSDEIAPGDLLIVEPGERITADVRFLETSGLLVDESALSGESAPVGKTARALEKPATERTPAQNIGFAGTTVVGGRGIGLVIATGTKTSFGEITGLAVETKHVSEFQKGIDDFSRFILRLILATLVVVVVANLLLKGASADVPELVIFAIALAVGVTPEALPVVTTFSMSRGALRLAKKKVVVKRLNSVEDLGSIEILCTDKTGTLTENRLTVSDFYGEDRSRLLLTATLASSAFTTIREANNAFDLALWEVFPDGERQVLQALERVREIPFDPEKRMNEVTVRTNQGVQHIIRGAPENVLERCSGIGNDARQRAGLWVKQQGEKGYRVLAVASKAEPSSDRDQSSQKNDFRFVGAVTFVDPLKHTARKALDHAKKLGVEIKILTGDSLEVATSVGKAFGLLRSPQEVISGENFRRLSATDQHETVKRCRVFARVSPQDKFNIIHLLREQAVVGFLGEGINDAPALKASNVGLVVAGAADIARETSDIVLLDKSLEVIVDGIREGREAFANTIKYIKATLSSNFGNFYAVALASFFVPFLPLLPLQILLVNLLSDFPMIAIATDSVDQGELARPRSYNIKSIVIIATVLGLVSTIFDLLFFAFFFRDERTLQTLWFMGSILTELLFLFSIRTRRVFWKARRPSAMILWLTGLAFALTLLIPFSHFGQRVFHFLQPTSAQLMVVVGLVFLYFLATEIVKNVYYRKPRAS